MQLYTGKNEFISINLRDNVSVVNIDLQADSDILGIQALTDDIISVKDPQILLSGGVDSELAVKAAIRSGKSFTAHTAVYTYRNTVINEHDIKYAIELMQEHNLTEHHILHYLDLEQFLVDGKFTEYAVNYQCISPQLSCHLWLLDQITSGTPVLGGDMMNFLQVPHSGAVVVWYREFKYFTYDIYFAKNQRPGVSSLLSNSPETVCASLRAQQNTVNHYAYMGQTNEYIYDRKRAVYTEMGFALDPKPVKYTGFEEIIQLYHDKYSRDPNYPDVYREFNSRFRHCIQQSITVPQDTIVMLSPLLEDKRKKYEDILNEHIRKF